MRGGRYIEMHIQAGLPTTDITEEERQLGRLQQLYTDLSRVQRRIEEERCQIRRTWFEHVLPIIEDLRRTVESDVVDPMELRGTLDGILKQLTALMEEQGVERIPSVGKPFDPRVHEAVIAEHRGEYPEWRVVEELEAGYRFRGRLIRPSKVLVVR